MNAPTACPHCGHGMGPHGCPCRKPRSVFDDDVSVRANRSVSDSVERAVRLLERLGYTVTPPQPEAR